MKKESDPTLFFKKVVSILALFIGDPSEACVATRKPATEFTKPSLEFFVKSVLKIVNKLSNQKEYDAKKENHVNITNNTPTLVFVFEYLVVYCKSSNIDLLHSIDDN